MAERRDAPMRGSTNQLDNGNPEWIALGAAHSATPVIYVSNEYSSGGASEAGTWRESHFPDMNTLLRVRRVDVTWSAVIITNFVNL
jgi:hypothetical protein